MGQAEFRKNPNLNNQINSYLNAKLELAGAYLEGEIKKVLTKKDNSSGKNPSKPGEAPAKQTGELSNNIVSDVSHTEIALYIGVDEESPANKYASALEFGTSKMGARPFLRNTVFSNIDSVIRIIKG